MLVLDTNHIQVLGYATAAGLKLLQRLHASSEAVVTTVIQLKEQMRGWLAAINRTTDVHKQMAAYDRLKTRTEFMESWEMLPWDKEAADLSVRLRNEGVRTATLDLKIACISLVHRGTLLSRNLRDFEKVPSLRIDNWLD